MRSRLTSRSASVSFSTGTPATPRPTAAPWRRPGERTARTRLAAALDAKAVEGVPAPPGAGAGGTPPWWGDAPGAAPRPRIGRRLDTRVLGKPKAPAEPGPATTAALLARVR